MDGDDSMEGDGKALDYMDTLLYTGRLNTSSTNDTLNQTEWVSPFKNLAELICAFFITYLRGSGSNGHNTLSGVPFGQLSLPLENLQGNCGLAVFQVGFSETQPARSSLADYSMGNIVGRKAPLTVITYFQA